MINPSERTLIIFSLSKGQSRDAPESRKLLKKLEKTKKKKFLPLDKTCEGEGTCRLTESPNFIPIVSLKSNRKAPWKYDKILYKCRNEIERLICRFKRFRRIFTLFDKIEISPISVIYFAFIIDALFRLNMPKNNIAIKQITVTGRTNIRTVQERNNKQQYQAAKF